MKRALSTIAAITLLAFGTAGVVTATQPAPDTGFHQVWVCKYVGQPGDFETLKPGKQPIIVDVASADAFVGADFADGQTHSYVIDLATDSNTGQGEKYIGEATCPTVTPSAPPSTEPSVAPSVAPTPSAVPSSKPSSGTRTTKPSLPNTATAESATVASPPSSSLLLLASLLSLLMGSLLLTSPRRR